MSGELAHFRRLLEHDGWANVAALVALRAGPAPAKARAWMAHIIGAERLWLARLRQEPSAMPVWPELDLDACAAELAGPRRATGCGAWRRSTRKGSDDGVAYRNSKGEFWTSTVADILTHVLLHAPYHRGQIAAADPGGRRHAGLHRLHPRRAIGAHRMSVRPSPGPLRSWRRRGARGARPSGLVRCAVLVRPAAGRYPDRARLGAGVHPARLDAGRVGRAEPAAVPRSARGL